MHWIQKEIINCLLLYIIKNIVEAIYKDILKAWEILEREFNIKHMSYNHAPPHITVLAGQTNHIDKIYNKLKKIKFKKFKLQSPGLGIFANEKPNLYIRWENNLKLLKNSEKIRKTTIHHFKKICLNTWTID